MSEVTDAILLSKIRAFLENADLNSATTRVVRKHLEEALGCDLTDKKQFINDETLAIVNELNEKAEADQIAAKKAVEAERKAKEAEKKAKEKEKAAAKKQTVSGNKRKQEAEDSVDEEEEQTQQNPDIPPELMELPRRKAAPKPKPVREFKKKAKKEGEVDDPDKPPSAMKKKNMVYLKPSLAGFLGKDEMTRGDITKAIHAYVKQKELKDPADGRFILCDDALQAVFKTKRLNMFKMATKITTLIIDPKYM